MLEKSDLNKCHLLPSSSYVQHKLFKLSLLPSSQSLWSSLRLHSGWQFTAIILVKQKIKWIYKAAEWKQNNKKRHNKSAGSHWKRRVKAQCFKNFFWKIHKLNTLKHLSAIQNFCRRESNSQSLVWVVFFPLTFSLTWDTRRAAQRAQAGAGGWGKTRKQQTAGCAKTTACWQYVQPRP